MREKRKQGIGLFLLILASLIWGLAFIAQSSGMEKIEGFTFSAVRQWLGGLSLLLFVMIREPILKRNMDDRQKAMLHEKNRKAILCGLLLGIVFCLGTNLQQYAFNSLPSGKIAFLTAWYLFFVPLLGPIVKKKVPVFLWPAVALGLVGMWFLCIDGRGWGGIVTGDYLSIGCALAFAVHILLIDLLTPSLDGVKVSCVQLLVSAVISTVLMFCFESPEWPSILEARTELLYAGIASCGIAYTLQIIGQKNTEAVVASLAMCLESVFAVIFQFLLLKEGLSGRELLGCAIMLVAIVISQLAVPLEQKMKVHWEKKQKTSG